MSRQRALEAAKYRLVVLGWGEETGRITLGVSVWVVGFTADVFGKLMPDFLLELVISFIIRLLHLCCGVAVHTSTYYMCPSLGISVKMMILRVVLMCH